MVKEGRLEEEVPEIHDKRSGHLLESGSRSSHGKLLILILASVLPWLAVFFIGESNLAYGVYVDDNLIGYVKNKEDIDSSQMQVQSCLAANYSDTYVDEKIKFEKFFVKNDVLADTDELKKNILTALNPNIGCYNLKVSNRSLGVVADKKSANSIVNKVADYYIDKNGIEKDQITETGIKNSVALEETKSKVNEIPNEDKLCEAIIAFNEKTKNEGLKIEIKSKEKHDEDIEPSIVIKTSSEMFKGQEKVLNEGTPGTKEVVKEITRINDTKVNEKVVKTTVTKEPEEKIILKGTKDPIKEDIDFLDVPSRGTVTSGFGIRWGRQHNGIDIAANIGDPVKAALDGVVTYSGWMDGYGYLIKLNHGDDIETLYGHCSKLNSKVGDKITKGEVIAQAGNTGRSTGPHIHFEVRYKGVPKDPTKYILK